MRYNSFIFILLFGISILSSCINTDITAEEPATIAPKVSPVHAIQPKALLPGGSLFTALFITIQTALRSPKAAVTPFWAKSEELRTNKKERIQPLPPKSNGISNTSP